MNFGDTPGWVRIAEAIASQDFAGIHVKQFRGGSYPAAALIKLTGLPDQPRSSSLALHALCSP
jgi:hypothetical protein